MLLAAEFFVSPQGDDTATGTKEKPFATLKRARDAVRALDAKEPVTVWLRGGTYFVEKPVEFTHEDSGTAACPVTYAAVPGEKPIIHGGRVITRVLHRPELPSKLPSRANFGFQNMKPLRDRGSWNRAPH